MSPSSISYDPEKQANFWLYSVYFIIRCISANFEYLRIVIPFYLKGLAFCLSNWIKRIKWSLKVNWEWMNTFHPLQVVFFSFLWPKVRKRKRIAVWERAGRETVPSAHWVAQEQAGKREEACHHPRLAQALKIVVLEKQKVVHRWENERCLQRTSWSPAVSLTKEKGGEWKDQAKALF